MIYWNMPVAHKIRVSNSLTGNDILSHIVGYMLKVNVALWHQMASEILVNSGPGNGLLFNGTKPLTEPMLTNHQ